MKRAIGICMCLSVVLFFACKKKSTAPAVVTTRVGNVYDDSSHLSTLYFYSPANLLRGDYDDSGKFNYAYHYLDGQSVEDVQSMGFPAYSVFYIWGSNSLVDSSDVISNSGAIGIRKKYSYDSNNYLTNVNWYSNVNALVLTETFTVVNGNITQHNYNVLDTSNAALPRGSYTYQYYTGQANSLSNTYFGQAYLGSSSTNPVKSVTYTYGSVTTITDYTYHYNGTLISSQLVFADSSGTPSRKVDSIAYSYYFD